MSGINQGSFGDPNSYETTGYWLASPSAYHTSDFYLRDDDLFIIGDDGYVRHSAYDLGKSGVRPLVSLKSDIKGKNENGVWKLATKQ